VKGKGCYENYEKAKNQFYYRPSFSSVKGSYAFKYRIKKLQKFHEIKNYKEFHFEKKMEENEMNDRQLNINEDKIEEIEVINQLNYPPSSNVSLVSSSSLISSIPKSWSFLSGCLSEYIIDILPFRSLPFTPVVAAVPFPVQQRSTESEEEDDDIDEIEDNE
jgi:hypothetical protein